MALKKALLGCLFFGLGGLPNAVRAQIFEPIENRPHAVGLSFGLNNNLIGLTLGYAYYKAAYKTSAFVDFTQASSLLKAGDFKAQIGLQTWQGSFHKFTLKNSLAFVHAQSLNNAGRYTGLGLNLVVNPGLRFKRFGLGADFQYNPFFATHIKHSDEYRQNFYGNVRDGWYGLTAQNVRLGLYLAQQLGQKRACELNFKGGYQSNGQYDRLAPNAYAIIGLNKLF
jgi:hypothetical protein